jgi:enoyl-CoA hydratase/carnithine racemase
MVSSLHRTLMAMEMDSDIRAICLRGADAFTLGADYLCTF